MTRGAARRWAIEEDLRDLEDIEPPTRAVAIEHDADGRPIYTSEV